MFWKIVGEPYQISWCFSGGWVFEGNNLIVPTLLFGTWEYLTSEEVKAEENHWKLFHVT